jgi:hypothetical protein
MLFCIEYHYPESDERHSGAHWWQLELVGWCVTLIQRYKSMRYRIAFSVDGRFRLTGVLITQQEVEQRDENGTRLNRDQKRQTSDSIKKGRTALPLVV